MPKKATGGKDKFWEFFVVVVVALLTNECSKTHL
jgi:hypothetical protein